MFGPHSVNFSSVFVPLSLQRCADVMAPPEWKPKLNFRSDLFPPRPSDHSLISFFFLNEFSCLPLSYLKDREKKKLNLVF